MSNKSDCCGAETYKSEQMIGGYGLVKEVIACSKCLKPCKIKSEPVPAPDRLLTDEEIKTHLYKISTAGEGYEFTEFDGTLINANHVRIKSLLQAQDTKTYPLAFEAGRKAQAEKDRQAISVISDCKKRIDEIEIKLNDREVDLIQAEKRGARALALLAKEVMDLLQEYGIDIVPHLLDNDENAGERLRQSINEVLVKPN